MEPRLQAMSALPKASLQRTTPCKKRFILEPLRKTDENQRAPNKLQECQNSAAGEHVPKHAAAILERV